MEALSTDVNIVINTGLSGFVALDRVLEVNTSRIVGTRVFSDTPAYLCLESLAQVGAFHVRYMTDYSRHVFLIKIVSCSILLKTTKGEHVLSGRLLGRADSSFCSFVKAERGKETVAEAELLYAAVDYDGNFKEDVLRNHYKKVFSCLQRDLVKS